MSIFPLCFLSSKLEKILNSGSKLDTKWKYLTGEWFYEAKSRRHMDKIHGSEIILASMKQKKALSGVFRLYVYKGLLLKHRLCTLYILSQTLRHLYWYFHNILDVYLPGRIKNLPRSKNKVSDVCTVQNCIFPLSPSLLQKGLSALKDPRHPADEVQTSSLHQNLPDVRKRYSHRRSSTQSFLHQRFTKLSLFIFLF